MDHCGTLLNKNDEALVRWENTNPVVVHIEKTNTSAAIYLLFPCLIVMQGWSKNVHPRDAICAMLHVLTYIEEETKADVLSRTQKWNANMNPVLKIH